MQTNAIPYLNRSGRQVKGKYTEEDIIKICQDNGIMYIDGYTTSMNTFNCICSCGQEWTTWLRNIKEGRKCRTHLFIKESQIIEICNALDITYIDGFIDTDKKFNCICRCGRPWSTLLATIKKGGSCAVCKGVSLLSSSDVENELHSYKLLILKPYVNAKTPIVYQCTCGGIGKTPLNCIRRGNRCGKCIENKWRKLFTRYGCTILQYQNASSITYKCHCGNIHTCRGDLWFSGKRACPVCLKTNRILKGKPGTRHGIYTWRKLSLERDNFECVSCNSNNDLHVHHIQAYIDRKDLSLSLDNSITLCSNCHYKLHSKYGINVGINNLNLFLGVENE